MTGDFLSLSDASFCCTQRVFDKNMVTLCGVIRQHVGELMMPA